MQATLRDVSIFFSPDRIQTIPFVLELRGLLDWVCTDSTLSLFHWLKMEDIYANIYILKCYRTAEKVSGGASCFIQGWDFMEMLDRWGYENAC